MIKAIFTDLGGVCLSNGWDSLTRRTAAKQFMIDFDEMEARHQMIAGIYEEGKLPVDAYLDFVVFHVNRDFDRGVFLQYMKDQSTPCDDMLQLYRDVKAQHQVSIVAVSNEGRELAEHRIKAFDLPSIIDYFIVSSFLGYRKPDPNIFKMALDIAQVAPDDIVYIDDRAMLVEAAGKMGLRCLWHQGYVQTKAALERYGLGVAI